MALNKRIFLLLFFLAVLSSNVFSQGVFVTLKPVFSQPTAEIYSGEVAQFELIVINNEQVGLENFNARLSVSPELALVVDDVEKSNQVLSFVFLQPNSSNSKLVFVKGVNFSQGDLPIKVEYGFGENLSNSFSTAMRVLKNPLFVNARLQKEVVGSFEKDSVLLDLKNDSSFSLKNVVAALVVPVDFENNSSPLQFDFFSKEQAVLNASFDFETPQEFSPDAPVVLAISFEDERGPHFLQEKLFVQPLGKNNNLLFFAIALIILVLLGAVFLNSKNKNSGKKVAVHPESHSVSHESNSKHH